MENTNLNFFYETFAMNDEQKKQYSQYYHLICEYNKVMNLTGIDDEFGVYLKHFYDSLLTVPFIKRENLSIADLGSGAGFPGIVLAIYFPNNSFTLIEPMQKRCNFLNIVVDELKLENVTIVNKRAEEIDKEQFDIVTSRAVAKLNILLELAIPLLKKDGLFIAYKGANALEEIQESQEALKKLKSVIIEERKEIIPYELSTRYNLIIQKKDKTLDKYPRNYGQIKKNPL